MTAARSFDELDPEDRPVVAMMTALKFGHGTGEDLRAVTAFFENSVRGTTAEPYTAPLRALAVAHDTADPVDPLDYLTAMETVAEHLAADVALDLLGGPNHDAGMAWLNGTWTPEGDS